MERLDFPDAPAHMETMKEMPRTLEEIGCALAPLHDFWTHWGFEPWSYGPFTGVVRRQRFVKGGFLGVIAEYRAWDCIVWQSGAKEDREMLWREAKPMPEVVTQRFLFLVDEPWRERRIRSFRLGFQGYVEFYAYRPNPKGGFGCEGAKDLTDLADMGLRLHVAGHADRNSEIL